MYCLHIYNSTEPASLPAGPYTPKHDFNPMDCTDIVIGTARNRTSRVLDYYTRDRLVIWNV